MKLLPKNLLTIAATLDSLGHGMWNGVLFSAAQRLLRYQYDLMSDEELHNAAVEAKIVS
jgi:hypothetical protein